MGKRRKTERLVVVLVSDTHAGHRLALLNPATILLDEHGVAYSPGLTDTQRYLWELYQSHVDNVAEIAGKSPVVLLHNGDVTQGDRYPAHLTLPLVSDQIIAATENLRPWFEHKGIKLRAARIIAGTGVHTWEGASEVLVAQRLQSEFPDVDCKPLRHAQIALTGQGGQVIDVAHHGPFPGSRKWLHGSNAAWYLRSAMLDELVDGRTPPRVYARAHYHTFQHVGPVRVRRCGVDVESELIISPCYTGADDYVRKVTRSIGKMDHGLVVAVFEGGLREVVPLYQELDIRTRETL